MSPLELAELAAVALSPLGAAIGAYVAVRVKLAGLEQRMRSVEKEAARANGRIDRILERAH